MIEPNSYVPDERIIGDLEELGWVVVRGVRINESTYKHIDGVVDGRGHGTLCKVMDLIV